MRTPLQATLWELWRTSWFERASGITFHSGLIVWISVFSKGLDVSQMEVIRGVVIMLLAIGSLFSMSWLSALDNETTFTFRLGFTRPISTTQLVVVPMLYSIALAVVSFLAPASLFCLVGGQSLPLTRLASGVACVAACLIASVWSPSTKAGRWLSLTAATMGVLIVLIVFHSRHSDSVPWLMAMGRPGYFDVTWRYYAACAASVLIALVVTIMGVDRQRHGDVGWRGFAVEPAGRAPDAVVNPLAMRVFSGPFAAQFWYEMRRAGRTVMPLAVLAPLFPLVLVISVPWLDANWKGATGVWLAAIAFCPYVYQLVATEDAIGLRRVQGATRLSSFDAIRPLSNDQLIVTKLIAIAACSFFGLLCMAITAGLHSIVAGDWQAWRLIFSAVSAAVGGAPPYWWAIGACVIVLQYLSSTSMLLALGLWMPRHPLAFATCVLALFSAAMLAVWDAQQDWRFLSLWTTAGYAAAGAVVIACGFALRRAFAAGYLGQPFFILTAGLWAVYVASAIAIYARTAPILAGYFHMAPPLLALGASLLLVPLAATAAAPLALASHRHA